MPEILRVSWLSILAALLLTGCGMFPWFGGEIDPRPPTPLTQPEPQEIIPQLLWTQSLGRRQLMRTPNLLPVLDTQHDRLYVANHQGTISALSATTGRIHWQQDTGLPFSGGPQIAGEQLIIGAANGVVVAVALADGTERWRTSVDSEILSLPRIAGEQVLVHAADDSIHSLDLATGASQWRYLYPAPTLTLRGASTPVIVDNSAVVGIAGGRLVRLDLADGSPLWEVIVSPPRGRSEIERIADITADPLVVGDTIYVVVFNGDLAAVDLLTGSVLWRRQLSSHAGFALADEVLYITDASADLWAAAASDGAGIWHQEQLRHRQLTAPAIDGIALVAGDVEGWLHWIARDDGRLLARLRIARAAIVHRPLVADGQVIVQATDGTVAVITRP